MRAIRVVFRAELQHRWRSWLALTILVALVGGTVLGAVAAGRSTASAFPRFLARYGYDVQVFNFAGPLPLGLPRCLASRRFTTKCPTTTGKWSRTAGSCPRTTPTSRVSLRTR